MGRGQWLDRTRGPTPEGIEDDESGDIIVLWLTFSFQSDFVTDRVWAKNTVDLFSHEVFVINLSRHKKILRTI